MTPAYNPLSDYALIGDTHSTALIDRNGSIDWLCWPRHDSPALFLRILDAAKGGACTVALDGIVTTTRHYLPDTNILRTHFITATGAASLTDLMPVNPPDTLAEEGPDGETESRLIRLLECTCGSITARVGVRPTFDYARQPSQLARGTDGSIVFTAGTQRLRAGASHPLEIDADTARGTWSLRAGECACLVLTHGEDDVAPAFNGLDDAQARLAHTRRYWEEWSRICTYHGPYRAHVLRSILCLKLLTYAPTGAIIAAPTASLPEALPGNRSYDYRYAWLRDCSFTVISFVGLGYEREAAEYLRFLRHADPTRGRAPKLLYGIDGEPNEPQTLDHLEGWRGHGPVTIGNAAQGQSQLDIYGEVLAALHGYLEHVDYDPPEKVQDHLPETVTNLAEQAIAHHDDPDQGIWELRGAPRHILHSKGMNRVALDCAIRIGRRTGRIDPATLARWEDAASAITAQYQEQGWNDKRGAYTMFYGSGSLDAAVLRLVLYRALDAHDPRIAATLERIEAELGTGDLLYRYRMDDGMSGDEATFTACAFWRAGVLAMMGRQAEASPLFERLLTRGNDVGLFAEQIDAATGEQRGNIPQGFTHMALVNTALQIEASLNEGLSRQAW
ncbi:glycoside hydrolase family 15 protein [Lichenicoccus sp.]|uniref:glycoside hydrolase family 15 protein n=1 Tax=Lichenicoccus sp. TaxID=2781899 RepID=UPI003D09F039